jgi:hypothetical protein
LSGIDSESAIRNNEGLIEQDPEFVSPSQGAGKDYDGLTANWSLAANSSCIDNGSINIDDIYRFRFLSNDISGEDRILMDSIDIGPYEFRNFAPEKTAEVPDQKVYADSTCDIHIPVNSIFNESNVRDILIYNVSAIDPPVWLNLDIVSDNITISGTPGNNDIGITKVVLYATDLFGAEITDTFNIEVLELVTTAVNNITDDYFTIYPVPAKDNIIIESLFRNENEYTMKIIDSQGKIVKEHLINTKGSTLINVSSIPPGLYSLRLQSERVCRIYKIVVLSE